ncbi:NADP-dependent oxidoreductase [Streptomyces zagrosensis]|uniref:NADPH:quinone reductase-like Zn-dependent oxidoreductase n=1 Tax=Streptomyces zagrosensis TaxID=1042984 RepID=A0A7W9QGX0_9ACTN|nr:NADP-dependent oxidoreductase [Streptomyces zagrosensis]MBB5940055.1 NADPH:quinone reductase-like Zn-dependent oxidoreductase [Streptomyces zagrosensis]
MTENMRIIRQETLGGPDVLRLTEVERPTPQATEILVAVRAAGVNPADWKVRQNGYWLTPPFGVGWDVSGVVAEVPPGESRFVVGDEVYGMPRFPAEAGAYAEYVAAPSRHFARKPKSLDHVAAAALPLAALTAWQGLVEVAQIREGQRVLIHAAAGGVGHLAVQIAKAHGAYVIGTARAAKHELLRDLGADELIDYTEADFADAVRDVDVVLDLVGGAYEERSLRTLRRGGILVTVPNPLAIAEAVAKAAAVGARAATVQVAPDHTVLEHLATLVDEGTLRPLVAQTFPLAEAAKAHELGEANRTTGKIVLTV